MSKPTRRRRRGAETDEDAELRRVRLAHWHRESLCEAERSEDALKHALERAPTMDARRCVRFVLACVRAEVAVERVILAALEHAPDVELAGRLAEEAAFELGRLPGDAAICLRSLAGDDEACVVIASLREVFEALDGSAPAVPGAVREVVLGSVSQRLELVARLNDLRRCAPALAQSARERAGLTVDGIRAMSGLLGAPSAVSASAAGPRRVVVGLDGGGAVLVVGKRVRLNEGRAGGDLRPGRAGADWLLGRRPDPGSDAKKLSTALDDRKLKVEKRGGAWVLADRDTNKPVEIAREPAREPTRTDGRKPSEPSA